MYQALKVVLRLENRGANGLVAGAGLEPAIWFIRTRERVALGKEDQAAMERFHIRDRMPSVGLALYLLHYGQLLRNNIQVSNRFLSFQVVR